MFNFIVDFFNFFLSPGANFRQAIKPEFTMLFQWTPKRSFTCPSCMEPVELGLQASMQQNES